MGKIYFFYGEEKYDIEQNVQKIKKEFGNLELGINLFYIDSENVQNLEQISSGVSFFGEEKLIIMKNTKLKFDVDFIEKEKESGKTYIIIEDSVDKRTSEYKKLSKIAETKEFKFMDQKQIIAYIIKILEKCSLKIDYKTAEYMAEVCGENKANIINELNKIVLYKGSGSTVDKETIDKVCVKTLNAKIFDMLDFIVNKDHKNGILLLDELLIQKEAIVKIYIMLYKQVKQMYMIKILKAKRENDIATRLQIHPYVFQKLSKTSDKYRIDELKSIMKLFDKYDEATKSGEMDFEVGLKKIICSM